jgi:hypothetical protein
VIHVDRIEGSKLVEHRGVANIMDLMQPAILNVVVIVQLTCLPVAGTPKSSA